jgi:hypothetical protein
MRGRNTGQAKIATKTHLTKTERGVKHLCRRFRRANHFHKLHNLHGIEEVHANQPIRAPRWLRHEPNLKRGRIGGENAFRLHDGAQLTIQLGFDSDIFHNRLMQTTTNDRQNRVPMKPFRQQHTTSHQPTSTTMSQSARAPLSVLELKLFRTDALKAAGSACFLPTMSKDLLIMATPFSTAAVDDSTPIT